MLLLFPECRETHVTETYTQSSGWRNWTLNNFVAQDRHKKPLPHENYLWLCYFTTYLFQFVLFFFSLGTRSDEIITTAFLFMKKHFRFLFSFDSGRINLNRVQLLCRAQFIDNSSRTSFGIRSETYRTQLQLRRDLLSCSIKRNRV